MDFHYGMDWREPTPRKWVLRDMIFAGHEPEPSEYERIYQILINDEEPIVALLEISPQNNHCRSVLVESPDYMLPRLSYFLEWPVAANEVIKIPAAFTQHLILPLANEPPEKFDVGSAGYQTLILHVLDLYIALAGIATVSLVTLRELISRVLDMPYKVRVIEKIVSERTGAALLTDLFAKDSLIAQTFKASGLRLFGDRLAKLISRCITSHGSDTDDIALIWDKMEALHRNLEGQIVSLESEARRTLTPIGTAAITLDQNEQELLHFDNIAIPYNVTTARHAIESLQRRHKNKINLMLKSFPCATCKAQLVGMIKKSDDDIQSLESQRELTDINAPLGVFPLYLSDAAMRDLKSSRMDGNLSMILVTLQKLADGMWELDRELSVSTIKTQAKSGLVLHAARWCDDGYVLWERGVGRAEENSEDWIQIIKIIRVGPRAEMKKIISDARKAQRKYSKEYKGAATITVRDSKGSGALVPKRFIGKDTVGLGDDNVVVLGSPQSKELAPGDALILHKIFCTGNLRFRP
ncbi:hypothetical protein TWF481_001531 [Arthrobotrys musiformis]|uniref:Uncharacterized protein n=1 Tax=Arthrobotrys musiformis TaxID=47236 RepID=A0AAV9WS87_9PEZI